MDKKITLFTVLIASIISILIFFYADVQVEYSQNTLFQISTITALTNGDYQGKITINDLLEHGDFGLGALEDLNGELVCLNAACYQVKVDGMAYLLSPEAKVSFAAITFFDPDIKFEIAQQQNRLEFQKYIDNQIIEKDEIYAIKVEGFFSDITTRSIPKQVEPYPMLSEVVSNQTLSNFTDVDGTLIGYFIPIHLKEINVPGYHFHFITSDQKFGGHLIDLNMANGTIEFFKIDDFEIYN